MERFKTALAFLMFEAAIADKNCPTWARVIGWALILAAFVAHNEKG